MRVISQDGAVDVPYETGSLNMICAELVEPKRTIIYYYHSCFGTAIKLAEYSAKAKALKAMEMLKRAYENNMFYHCMANTKRFEEAQNILSVEQFRKATTEYFQFPQDDEIEV